MKKRIVALLLSVLILCTLLPVSALADNIIASDVFDGYTWSYDDEGTLTIKGTGRINSYGSSVEHTWLEYHSDIKKIVLENGITNIGDYLFQGCSSLESIIIPPSVVSIGFAAFRNCTSLTDVVIPPSVNEIGCDAFAGCTSLESVILPYDIPCIASDTFQRCNNLKSLSIPSSVSNIYDEFSYCYNIKDIYFGGTEAQWNAFAVNRFNESIADTTIHFKCEDSHNYTATVTAPTCVSNGYTTYTCSDCGYSYVDNFTLPTGHNYVDGVCTYCGNSEIIASGKCGENVTFALSDSGVIVISGTGAMFNFNEDTTCPWADYRNSITDIVIDEGITSIGDCAFSQCLAATDIVIGSDVIRIGERAFDKCDALSEIQYNGTIKQWESIDIGDYNDALASHNIVCTDGTIDNASITNRCGSYATWTFENGVLTISGKGNMYDFEYNWEAFEDDEYINYPWYSFRDDITSVVIEEGITSIGTNAFNSCNSLNSITIPEGITKISDYAFMLCDSLVSITIPNSVESISADAFFYCSNLKDIQVKSNNSNYSSQDGILYNKEKTELLRYPEGKTGEVRIPSSVTSIADYAFALCNGLTSITVPDSITYIGSCAFCNCKELKSITIGNGVTSIGEDAFYSCNELKDVYYCGSEEQWKAIEIGYYNNSLIDANIHYNYEPDEPDCRISVSSEKARAGEEVTVSVILDDNPGIMAMVLDIDYDTSKLELLGVEDGILTNWVYSGTAVWLGDKNITENGVILKLKFKVLEDAPDGDVAISVSAEDGNIGNYDEESLAAEITNGNITVYSTAPGDMNNDGKINALDLVRLKKFFSGENVVLEVSADLNGDGSVNALDLVRLQKYISGAAVELH